MKSMSVKWFPQLILQSFHRWHCVCACVLLLLLRLLIRSCLICTCARPCVYVCVLAKCCLVTVIDRFENVQCIFNSKTRKCQSPRTFPEYSVTYRTIYMHVIFSFLHIFAFLHFLSLSLSPSLPRSPFDLLDIGALSSTLS